MIMFSARTGDQVAETFEHLAKVCADAVKSEVSTQVYVLAPAKQQKSCFERFKE